MRPNISSYNVVIDANAKSGDMDTAVEWLSKAQEAKLLPNIVTYNAVIDAGAKSGDMDLAVELLSKAQEAKLEPNIANYFSATLELPPQSHTQVMEEQHAQQSVQVQKVMERASKEMDHPIIDACLKSGDIEQVAE